MSSKMSKICDKSVFVIFRPINTHYCHSRGCTLQHNLHSVFSQRPCSPDTYFAMQCYSRVHYFALYFSCIFNLKRIGSQVNEDDDFHNLKLSQNLTFIFTRSILLAGGWESICQARKICCCGCRHTVNTGGNEHQIESLQQTNYSWCILRCFKIYQWPMDG